MKSLCGHFFSRSGSPLKVLRRNVFHLQGNHFPRSCTTFNTVEQKKLEQENQEGSNESENVTLTRRTENTLLHNFKLGTIDLPKNLRHRLDKLFKTTTSRKVKQDATFLSQKLISRTTTRVDKVPEKKKELQTEYLSNSILYNKERSLAYVAHRLPGIYGCNYRVFREISTRLGKTFQPKNLLDFGSGPGTVVWAASNVWNKNEFDSVLAVEPSTSMIEIAEKLLQGFKNVEWRRFFFSTSDEAKYDLVVASYVMSELKDDTQRNEVINNLWNSTEEGGVLVIIEPGTPLTFDYVKNARKKILEAKKSQYKAEIVGPCPHVFDCPMTKKTWCHFVQRVQRTPYQIQSKEGASVNFEDEKFSYVAFQKVKKEQKSKKKKTVEPESENNLKSWGKLVRSPLKRGGHVILDICTPQGNLERKIVAKSFGKLKYAAARKSFWGDAIEMEATDRGKPSRRERKELEKKEKEEKLLMEEQSKQTEKKKAKTKKVKKPKKKAKKTGVRTEKENNEEEESSLQTNFDS